MVVMKQFTSSVLATGLLAAIAAFAAPSFPSSRSFGSRAINSAAAAAYCKIFSCRGKLCCVYEYRIRRDTGEFRFS